MKDLPEIDLGRHARRLRVDTSVRLRWLAIVGQAAAVVVTHLGFEFPLPFGACLLVIALSAWLNFGLRLRLSVTRRLDDGQALGLLAFDVAQLSALLFLTGGLQNPFSLLFLAPVMISAASLSPGRTLGLACLACGAATVLAVAHMPLPWYPDAPLALPFLYTAGIWIAIVLGVAFIGIYASRVAEEARQLSDALAATELVLAREQHLTQLDGLAAAAAHELGTPLATITLVAKELATFGARPDSDAEKHLMDDIALLNQEAARCRAILSKLTSLGDGAEDPMNEMSLGHLIEDVVGPQRDFGVRVRVDAQGAGPEPTCRRNPGIVYGLGNLVENAVDFASNEVVVRARWTRDTVTVTINDDGPGFSPDILMRLGEPYVTSRGANRRAKSTDGFGLGLGLFIAKTLLERSGAVVTPRNAPPSGAVVEVAWPRAQFDRGRAPRGAFTGAPVQLVTPPYF